MSEARPIPYFSHKLLLLLNPSIELVEVLKMLILAPKPTAHSYPLYPYAFSKAVKPIYKYVFYLYFLLFSVVAVGE